MIADITSLPGWRIAAGVRSGELSALVVAEEFLRRIDALNPVLNIFTDVTRERALSEAAAVDAAITSGRDPGPLAGVPYSVKNLFDLEGVVTLAGSKINRDDPPASRDATAVSRLAAAGAVCVGAVNMGEYAYDFTTVNAHYGATLNPHDPRRSAGGSSGGSGAGVAAAMCSLSLGTDTNGSIRVPSSFCGVWGLKPGYGRLSRAGAFLFAGSLDTIGPLGRSVKDLAIAFDAMSGPDERDPVCNATDPSVSAAGLDDGIDGLRIAMLAGYFADGGAPHVHTAAEMVGRALGAGATIELPRPDLARTAAYLITAAEGGELHRKRLAERAADFDPNMRDRFIAGMLAPAKWSLQAQRFRAWWRAEMRKVFDSHDILIAPATPLGAPTLDQETMTFRGKEIPLRPNIGVFTQPITLIGLPVIAAPVHLPGEQPIAVQLISRPGNEAALLRAARRLEAEGICAAPVATGFERMAA